MHTRMHACMHACMHYLAQRVGEEAEPVERALERRPLLLRAAVEQRVLAQRDDEGVGALQPRRAL